MIAWLASYPRSGNTLFRILVNNLYGEPTYSTSTDLALKRAKIGEAIGQKLLPKQKIAQLRNRKGTYVVKSHHLPPLLKGSRKDPVIFLVRDARDSFVSHARWIKKYRPSQWSDLTYEEVLKRLIEESKWSDMVNHWKNDTWHANSSLVQFEDLIVNPTKVASFAITKVAPSWSLKSEDPPNFDEWHEKWPNFFRKGKVGSWKEEMPEDLHELFWENHGAAMEKIGYAKTDS